VRKLIGPIAKPDRIQFARDLPKTRSGKIMRRILRKLAAGEREMEAFGDLSTLADPKVVKELVAGARLVLRPDALRGVRGSQKTSPLP
jgi:acetyl-CoA synthetase